MGRSSRTWIFCSPRRLPPEKPRSPPKTSKKPRTQARIKKPRKSELDPRLAGKAPPTEEGSRIESGTATSAASTPTSSSAAPFGANGRSTRRPRNLAMGERGRGGGRTHRREGSAASVGRSGTYARRWRSGAARRSSSRSGWEFWLGLLFSRSPPARNT